jgi:hypothetical protein
MNTMLTPEQPLIIGFIAALILFLGGAYSTRAGVCHRACLKYDEIAP